MSRQRPEALGSGPLTEEAIAEITFDAEDGPSEATRDAIRRAVTADLRPVEILSVRRRMIYVLAAGVMCALLAVVSFGAAGIHGMSRQVVGVAVAGVVALLAALAIGGSFTPRGHALLGSSTRGLVVATLIVGWTIYLFSGMTDEALASAFAGPAIGCWLRSLGAGILGGGVFMFIWRGTDPWTPRLSGALIGACAGTIASAGVGIPCPSVHGGHLLIGHWLAVPVLALLGALVARRVLEP
ncbi:MAG: NrsF family protein [Polyangiaceae bacterium]